MGVVRHENVIDGPRERIFEYVNGYENVPKYMFGVTRFEPVGDVTSGVGSVFEVSIDIGPKTLKSTVECVEWAENELIVLRAIKGFKADTTWKFADVDGGTQVCAEFRYTLPGGLVGRALGALIGPFGSQAARHAGDNIVEYLAQAGD